eukprot:5953155-Lingulodinium_polyedra.AAC.1
MILRSHAQGQHASTMQGTHRCGQHGDNGQRENACTRARYVCHTSVHAQVATNISEAQAHGVPAS